LDLLCEEENHPSITNKKRTQNQQESHWILTAYYVGIIQSHPTSQSYRHWRQNGSSRLGSKVCIIELSRTQHQGEYSAKRERGGSHQSQVFTVHSPTR